MILSQPVTATPPKSVGQSCRGLPVFTASWDDGDKRDLRVAELFRKHSLPCTFYAPAGQQNGGLSPSELRLLSSEFEVGGHTVSHSNLPDCTEERARWEIVTCKRMIEDVTGKPVSLFCFPGGYFSRKHLKMVKDAGYVGARTCELLSLRFPRSREGLLVIPTTFQLYDRQLVSYGINVFKRAAAANLPRLLRMRKAHSLAAAAELLLEEARLCQGVFHLWGHSVELDRCNSWQDLDAVLRLVSERRSEFRTCFNSELCSVAAE